MLSLKTYVNVPSLRHKQKKLSKKLSFFVGILKATAKTWQFSKIIGNIYGSKTHKRYGRRIRIHIKCSGSRARIFKRLRSPGIDSKE
jgi:hypothetical protein